MKICIIGIDGSGKTTLAQKLTTDLNAQGMEAIYFHPGRARNNLKLIRMLLGRPSRHLICDRGYYDSIVGIWPKFLVRPAWLIKFILHLLVALLPKFHRVIRLDLDQHMARKRREEGLAEAEYIKRFKLYSYLDDIIEARIINASASPEQVAETARQVISPDIGRRLSELAERSQERIAALPVAVRGKAAFLNGIGAHQNWLAIQDRCYGKQREKYLRSVALVHELESNHNLSLPKSYKTFDYIANDIDVLTLSPITFKKLKTELTSRGFSRLEADRYKFWDNCHERYKEIWVHRLGAMAHIHLHRRIAWRGVEFVDAETVGTTERRELIFGRRFFVPHPIEDALIQLAHIIFEVHYLKTGDLIHLSTAVKAGSITLPRLAARAQDYNWEDALVMLVDYIGSLDPDGIELPHRLPTWLLAKARWCKLKDDLISARPWAFSGGLFSFALDGVMLLVFKPLRRYGLLPTDEIDAWRTDLTHDGA